ncbi:hypothetical protein [uncultured Thiodictyon sp.]|uniref:hypothetical protein n=1 Tax=uncultured Thiodictyon sp. TaxID=1846217 RepID=UPI00341B733F
MRYPNQEVYQSLINSLLKVWTPDGQPLLANKRRLGEILLANDFAGLEQLVTAFFASIPNDWYRNNPIARYEGYYASVFYAYFAALGLVSRDGQIKKAEEDKVAGVPSLEQEIAEFKKKCVAGEVPACLTSSKPADKIDAEAREDAALKQPKKKD